MEINNTNNAEDLLSSLKNNNNGATKELEIIFKNYIPYDKSFKFEKNDKYNEVKQTEEKIQKNVLKSIKDFVNLDKKDDLLKEPKKNYDLKRNIADKMIYLNNETLNALNELKLENKNN